MNVRGGRWFVEEPYEDGAGRLEDFVEGARGKRLLVLELGSGFNTPGVVRWPLEAIVQDHPTAQLIRVNPERPEVPRELRGRAISLHCGAKTFLNALAAVR